MSKDYSTPRLYVGTYAKYNNGSIKGAWLDLDDEDSFWEAARELHKDEADPEFMFQDYEGLPKELYHESSIDERLWEWIELDDREREIVAVCWDEHCGDLTIEQALEGFEGRFDSEEDWARDFFEQMGYLSEVPKFLQNYIDYKAYANDARCGGDVSFCRHDGDVWVFNNRY